jgi:pimeloyl-ACP methyl ester carboxylesterase
VTDTGDPWEGDELRQRARKVDPRYADGPLVKVARARHQAEAEMMEHLLLDQGIPSVAKRSGGFDVPDFLAAGPRDILVPASGAEAARETLGVDEPAPVRSTVHGTPPWVRTLAVVLTVLLVVVLAAFVITAIV